METDEKKSVKSVSWKRRILRWLLTAAVVLLLALAAFVLSIPYLLTHVPIPELEFDLSPRIKGKLAELTNPKAVFTLFYYYIFYFIFKYLFTWLHWVLAAAYGI